MKLSFKTILPHLVAFLIFLSITVAYFGPVVLGNKQIIQGDVVHHKGMSKEIVDYRKEHHEEPLWTNRMFGGMPAFQISTLYPSDYISYVASFLTFGLPHPVYAILIAMLGFYLLLIVLRVDPWTSLFGSIAYGLSSFIYTVIEAGHNSQAIAIAYMPAVFAGFVHVYRNRKILAGTALTALALSLEVYANHLQMTYYLLLVLVFYVLAEFIGVIPANRAKYAGAAMFAFFILLLFMVFDAKIYFYLAGALGLYLMAEIVIGLLKKNPGMLQFVKGSIGILIAVGLSVGANLGNLRSTADYGKYTTRGASDLTINPDGSPNEGKSGLDPEYATQWSYGIDETFTLLIPNYKGGSSSDPIGKYPAAIDAVQDENFKDNISKSPSYFGDQPFTSGPVYVGAIVVFLFVLGLFIVEGPLKWALLGATLLSIMLSWGHNYNKLSLFFLEHVPGYNKFRSVSFVLVMAELAMPLLAVLAVSRIVANPGMLKQPFANTKMPTMRMFIVALAITGGFCLINWLSPSAFNHFIGQEEAGYLEKAAADPKQAQAVEAYINSLQEAREQIVKVDAGRSFLFISVVALGLLLYSRKTINKYILAGSMAVLVCLDMVLVDRRYLNKEDFEPKKKEAENPFADQGRPGKADLVILEDKTPDFRVFNLLVRPDQDAATSYFHNSLGGYHGAKLKRYQELIDFHIGKSFYGLQQVLKSRPDDSTLNMVLSRQGVINMLNTKYIIYNYDAPPIKNPYALGNAWFVENYQVVPNADSEIVELGRINPGKTAVVDQKFKKHLPAEIKPDPSASIRLLEYQPNHLTYQSKSSTEQLAVFSEIYYPSGWNAYVDGVLKDHFGVDFVLRAMAIPPGEHKVEFKFEPSYYYNSEKISLVCSLLVILGSIGIFAYQLRKPAEA